MNCYTEMELRHGTGQWDVLRAGFLLTFTFEDRWSDTVDDALEGVKNNYLQNTPGANGST